LPQPLRTSLALSPDLSSVPPAPGREAASHMSPWQRQPCRTLITKTAQVDGGKEDRKREILRLENTLPLALPAFGTRRTSGSLQLGFWTGCAPHTHTHTHTHTQTRYLRTDTTEKLLGCHALASPLFLFLTYFI